MPWKIEVSQKTSTRFTFYKLTEVVAERWAQHESPFRPTILPLLAPVCCCSPDNLRFQSIQRPLTHHRLQCPDNRDIIGVLMRGGTAKIYGCDDSNLCWDQS